MMCMLPSRSSRSRNSTYIFNFPICFVSENNVRSHNCDSGNYCAYAWLRELKTLSSITDMQHKYCCNCWHIYLVRAQYKGYHRRGGAAEGRATFFVAAAKSRHLCILITIHSYAGPCEHLLSKIPSFANLHNALCDAEFAMKA